MKKVVKNWKLNTIFTLAIVALIATGIMLAININTAANTEPECVNIGESSLYFRTTFGQHKWNCEPIPIERPLDNSTDPYTYYQLRCNPDTVEIFKCK